MRESPGPMLKRVQRGRDCGGSGGQASCNVTSDQDLQSVVARMEAMLAQVNKGLRKITTEVNEMRSDAAGESRSGRQPTRRRHQA